MDVLILFHERASNQDNATTLQQLLTNVHVTVMQDFQKAVRHIAETAYQFIVMMTREITFPKSWSAEELHVSSPVMILAGVNNSSLLSLQSFFDALRENSREQPLWDNPLFANSLSYIELNLCEPELSLEQVASQIYVSRCHYSRMFQKYVGTGFKEYIMTKRIQKAKQLLQKGDPVTEVCYAVGYNDLTHFGRVFKKLVGVNPSEFRHKKPVQLFPATIGDNR